MKKPTAQKATPQKTPPFAAPRWMTRLEKADFRRVIDARNAVSKPVLATEFDTLCDYVTCRSRIRSMRLMVKTVILEATKINSFGDKPFPPSQRHAASLIRQLDTTTAMSRRLARDLQLLGTE